MENSKTLIGAFFVIMATVFMASGASAGNDLSDFLEDYGCELIGGTIEPQPADSPITACCTETECYICDENGDDCTLDDSYRDPTGGTNPTAGNFTKPLSNAGTMIERPGTNPPADTRVKPIAPEAAIQNLIRN